MTAVTTLLAGIRERAEKATAAPWKAWDRGIGYEVHSQHDEPLNMGHRETFTKADAAFIAAARTDVPRLVAALEAVLNACHASDDGTEWDHNDGCEGEPTCAACWATDIRAAVTAAIGGGE